MAFRGPISGLLATPRIRRKGHRLSPLTLNPVSPSSNEVSFELLRRSEKPAAAVQPPRGSGDDQSYPVSTPS